MKLCKPQVKGCFIFPSLSSTTRSHRPKPDHSCRPPSIDLEAYGVSEVLNLLFQLCVHGPASNESPTIPSLIVPKVAIHSALAL